MDTDRFTQLAVEVMEHPEVRAEASRRITAELVATDGRLADAGPALGDGVEASLGTPAFGAAYRTSVEQLHATLFEEDRAHAALAVSGAASAVRETLEGIDPSLAARVPPQVDAVLLEIDRGPVLRTTSRVARDVGTAASLLPLLAALVSGLTVAVARDRLRALGRVGVAVALGAGVVLAAGLAARVLMASRVPDQSRPATHVILDAYLGPLLWLSLIVGVLGLLALLGAILVRRVRAL